MECPDTSALFVSVWDSFHQQLSMIRYLILFTKGTFHLFTIRWYLLVIQWQE